MITLKRKGERWVLDRDGTYFGLTEAEALEVLEVLERRNELTKMDGPKQLSSLAST